MMTVAHFRPQLGEPHHYAYLVDDIRATVDLLGGQLGAGPFFLLEDVPLESVRSRGEPAEFAHSSAFGYCAGGPIELIETAGLGPERVAERFSGHRPRVHHVAYVLPPTEVAEVRIALGERDLPQYLSSRLGEAETTLHDASTSLGHDIEIHGDNQGLRDFFGMVIDSATGWDGSEPLRLIEM